MVTKDIVSNPVSAITAFPVESSGVVIPDDTLVTNGDFSNGLTGWTNQNNHWTESGGKAVHPATSDFNMLLTDGIPAAGQSARIRFTISGLTEGGVRVQFRRGGFSPEPGYLYGTSEPNPAATNGSYDITVTVPSGAVYIGFARDDVAFSPYFELDNVIVQEV